ncbi:hypothetical protein Clacol_009464 [Clathrus columnatus]|uniref:BTB domain-containing protein n=1 Tax=Clathrus columnatus TaxID=1419009 RepID=A0AAV5AQ71_9AGAM|nr:hypothetical protein Clacol_009464 [Clathrus columnatus]
MAEISLQIPSKSDNSDQVATLANLAMHNTYYSVDEFVILKVENVLYRILKSVLTAQSEFFKDLFSPQFSLVIKDDKEGSSNSFPIVFEHVRQVDFDRLLSLIITGLLDPTVAKTWRSEQWMPILDLADKWQMPAVRQLALDSLKSLAAPHIKINLGIKFEERSLIKSGLIDICSRDAPMTETEATEIGMESTLKCVVIREKIWKKALGESSRSYSNVSYSNIGKSRKNKPSVGRITINLFPANQHVAGYVEEAFLSGILKVI